MTDQPTLTKVIELEKGATITASVARDELYDTLLLTRFLKWVGFDDNGSVQDEAKLKLWFEATDDGDLIQLSTHDGRSTPLPITDFIQSFLDSEAYKNAP